MEWLMEGQGMPPRPFEMIHPGIASEGEMEETLKKANLQEEQAIYQELQAFKTHNPNPIIITISDDTMEPQYHAGDYIGGIRISAFAEIAAYFGQICIVELEDHAILPRYIHPSAEPGTITLSCTNHQSKNPPFNIFNAKVISVAPILWHRKKLTMLRTKD